MIMLILKDFKMQRKMTLFIECFIFIYFILFSILNLSQVIIFGMLYVFMLGFVNRLFFEDEKNNSCRMLAALPVDRGTLVFARYTTVFIITALPAIISILVVSVLNSAGIRPVNGPSVNVTGILVVFTAAVLCFLSIQLPLLYRFGYKQASLFFTFLFLIFALFFSSHAYSSIFTQSLAVNPADILVRNIASSINIYSVIMSAAVIYIFSGFLSVRLFKRKALF